MREPDRTNKAADVDRIVRGHLNWVYASACRRVRDGALAEDVAQAVFLLLWRKLPELGSEVKLTGWLYRAVQYCSANAMRQQQIRRKHEREAAMFADSTHAGDRQSDITELLETAVDCLARKDRDAILLRFYRNMTLAEVGRAMGTTEDAARMRVQRALEKLRSVLQSQGVTATATSLGAGALANLSPEAPVQLAAKVAATTGGATSGTATTLAANAGRMMWLAKAKLAAAVIAGATVLGGSGLVAVSAVTGATAPTSSGASNPAATQQSVQIHVETRFITVSPDQIPPSLLDPDTRKFQGGTLSDEEVNSLLLAAQSEPSHSLVAAPGVLVSDGGEAAVRIMTDMPYQTVEATTQPSGKTSLRRVTKKVEDGLQLDVAAKTSNDHRYVRLTFKPELKRVLRFDDVEFRPDPADGQPIKAQEPVVQVVSLATTVNIRNGETLCLGGQTISPRKEASPTEAPADSILLILVKPVVISRPDTIRSTPPQVPARTGNQAAM